MKLKRLLLILAVLPLLLNGCGGKEDHVEIPGPPEPVQTEDPGTEDPGTEDPGTDPGTNPGQTNPWDANRGKIVTPSGSQWTSATVREGIIYYHFSGKDELSGQMEEIFAVDVDLNNSKYEVKLTRLASSAVTSTVHKNNNSIATINAGYEQGSIYIRSGGIDYSIIPNVQIGDTGQDNWKSEGAFWINSSGKPGIVFAGSPKRDGVITGIKGVSYADAVKKQRSYYMNDLKKANYPYLISSAPSLIDDFNPIGENFCDYNITTSQVNNLNSENLERHQRVLHPRTAIALTENNHLILIVVDGRQTNRKGFSARQLTKFLVKWFNPQYALNLDGGGSTAMCVEGQGDSRNIVNSPIQDGEPGKERARDTHIVVLAK